MMPSSTIYAGDFHDMLLLAAETERRLPAGRRPEARAAYWPDMKLDWMSYADNDVVPGLGFASAEQVDAYDLCLQIVNVQPIADARRLLWAAAHSAAFRTRGIAWGKLAKIRHCDRRKVKRDYEHALTTTVLAWNAADIT